IFRQEIPYVKLAPSVALDYDTKRYNKVVSNTLFSIEQSIEYKKQGLFDYVWLDEWDLKEEDGTQKKLYTKETFDKLREVGYKIALITPELHGTSPGLLGGESHQDSRDKDTLFKRIIEIISLNPDAICTDYPRESKNLVI
ncbi:MAG: hypothetical protein OQK82_04080, partial [Candidatus Pacearchaeota archaeon]|nr:hypothetical protein [Candidatus Pacearchaeota archaeon]